MQIMEGNLAATIERLLPRIGHMQIADVPARDEPGNGEINFDFLLRHIDRSATPGWIGCEYNPKGDTVEGLKWAQPYLSTQAEVAPRCARSCRRAPSCARKRTPGPTNATA